MRDYRCPFGPTLMVTLAAALALWGCAPKMVKTVEFGDPQTTLRVLIATEQSEFKQAVTAKLISGFENGSLFFKIIDLRNLETERVEAYTTVVIMNTCVAWNLNPRVKTFLETTPAGEKVIVLTTAGDPGWQAETAGVDAFTSASSPADVTRVAEQLRTRIRSIINVAS